LLEALNVKTKDYLCLDKHPFGKGLIINFNMEEKPIICSQRYQSPCGNLLLGSYEGKLCLCDWIVDSRWIMRERRLEKGLQAQIEDVPSDVTMAAAKQLDEYFAGNRQSFDMPLLFVGTDFQKEVWKELLSIPYGKTVSYGNIAQKIDHPSAVRIVGNSIGANLISIFVPCHRVIGTSGKLVGYAGGIDAKRYLLQLENPQFTF
jgi:methylated-DNA-[protein]-cysteine S-methyltransferase